MELGERRKLAARPVQASAGEGPAGGRQGPGPTVGEASGGDAESCGRLHMPTYAHTQRPREENLGCSPRGGSGRELGFQAVQRAPEAPRRGALPSPGLELRPNSGSRRVLSPPSPSAPPTTLPHPVCPEEPPRGRGSGAPRPLPLSCTPRPPILPPSHSHPALSPSLPRPPYTLPSPPTHLLQDIHSPTPVP